MAPPGGVPNNRVTQKQLYDALMAQNKEGEDRERRIMAKLECLPRIEEQSKTNKDEITRLRNRSNWIDVGLGMFTLVAAAISNAIGSKQ